MTKPPDGSEGRPSLILLDLNMPGTDGREALTRLKRDPALRSIPTDHLQHVVQSEGRELLLRPGCQRVYDQTGQLQRILSTICAGLVEYWDNVMVLPPPAKMLSKQGTTAMTPPITILLIDDNPEDRRIYRRFLEQTSTDYVVHEADRQSVWA